ncbi:MAG: hypothetical protein AAF889_01995 [Cyanobacteria bacterium P01_D01_bin.73]
MVDLAHLAQLAPTLWPSDSIHAIAEFSRANCLQICAFLVPANLAATLQTLMMMAMERPLLQVGLMAAIASIYAAVMVIHVGTWFAIGVVIIPTYVLLSFGLACCIVNVWAVKRLWNRRPSQSINLSIQQQA